MKQKFNESYNLLVKNNNINNLIKCDVKELLKNNPKLVVFSNDSKIYELDNIQSLYLFPLTIVDYIDNLTNKKIICMNIIEIDCDLDYKFILNNEKFKYLKSVEILIKEDISEREILKICDIIEYFYNKKIMVSLNIKNLINLSNSLIEKFKHVKYYKIFLNNYFDNNFYDKFLTKLLSINKVKINNSLVHIKTYLNINNSTNYEKMINDFSKVGVDIFQVSKELIPIGKNNINVDFQTQDLIRKLEIKYSDYNMTKFISVKDLTTLYYPRFELDDRNSRKCYSCYMKPYLFMDKILPCKVNKIFNDLNEWSSEYFDVDKYNNIIKKCGIKCDDCASIFENDLLFDIEKIIENKEDVKICLIKE